MILVVDCFKLVKGTGKSIGIYNLALNLIRNLVLERKRTDDETKGCKIVVLGNSYNESDFNIVGVEFVCIHHNPLNKFRCVWWELFEVSLVARKYKADKMIHPRGYAPILKLTKEYIIVHDMIPFYYNEHYKGYFNLVENYYIMWRLKASIRSCNHVITISEASCKDIIRRVKIPETKISIIYNGYNKIERNKQLTEKKDYIIAMTSKLPHKNADGIIHVYEKYYYKTEKPLKLIIIGIEDVEKYHVEEKVKANIFCYKYIESNQKMHQMIANAKIFLFLSLIEGFGFPPIEAMQLGTPVVCSSLSSLPEVTGDAAILVNPNCEEEVADALIRLQTDTNMQKQLVENGFENIKRFSWDKMATKYARILMR